MTRDEVVQAIKDIVDVMVLSENIRMTEATTRVLKQWIEKMEKRYYHTVLNQMRRRVERNEMTLATRNSTVKRKEKEEII